MSGCKGKIIGEEKKILERWTKHFAELLKEEEDKENYRGNPTPTTKIDQVPDYRKYAKNRQDARLNGPY
jgi:hypothetical protein